MPLPPKPFWETKSLDQMTQTEWESLCDGCAKCCLHKLEDADTGQISQTNVACRLLDLDTCQCTRYPDRKRLVPDCVVLDKDNVTQLDWMPNTCAYRLLANGQPLADWHPLVSGDPDTVHKAGISVTGRAISERDAGELSHYLVDWEV
ncbi:MAG: YcgN family cysteine cluster protein [Alphaproteobacteria bacterium]|nr:MAG: YcgN family cysteine cluster protein [Alphaproteobacteria bacterium]